MAELPKEKEALGFLFGAGGWPLGRRNHAG